MADSVHGTAVLLGADGILIRGEPGAGKSTLALALIEAGGRLVGDDRVILSLVNGRLLAIAPLATLGQIELFGHGIVRVPHERAAVIRLLVDIASDDFAIERMPDADAITQTFHNVTLRRCVVPRDTGRAVRLIRAALGVMPQRDAGLAPREGLGMMATLSPGTRIS